MSTHNCALHTHARKRAYDPTRTTLLRTKFEAEMLRRFRKLRSQIIDMVDKQDCFGLRERGIIRVHDRNFAFGNDAQKIAAFMQWLKQQQQAGVLEVRRGAPVSTSASRAWTDVYIESAYQKGVAQAGGELGKAGVEVSDRWIDSSFNRPVHADRVGLLFTRTYSDLEGVTEAMDRQISRVLAQGMIDGRGPREIARELADRVDKIGITRARVIARTEIISAHHQATINSYKEAGVEGVEIVAEFSTAGDGNVCPECESLNGKQFTIDEAQSLIPVHPNCRCTSLPKVISVAGIRLE